MGQIYVMNVNGMPLTVEDFYNLGLERAELVRGEVLDYPVPTPEHGMVVASLGSALVSWLHEKRLGRAGVRSGFTVGRTPDTVRIADVWFVSNERIPEDTSKFWEVAPDLVAEVISPSDTANIIKGKLTDYFAAGTEVVWLVYPVFRQVEAHSPNQRTLIFTEADTLEAPSILPGFGCKVSELFD